MTPNLPTLPAGWNQKTVGEISKIQSGFPVNKKNEIENGYVHLRTHNISTFGKLNFDYLVKVEHSMIKANCSSLKKDDILFNNTNSTELVGKTALVDQDYPYAFSNHLTKIELDKNIALPSFFVYYFMDLFTKGYFVSICNKWIGQSGVNTTMLKEITIPLPPLEEQRRLVTLLDTLFGKIDRSIELTGENIAAADALLPSALNTVFGELGEKWNTKKLDEISKLLSGYAFKSGDFSNSNEINVIKITNVGVQEFILDSEEKLPASFQENYSNFQVNENDIAIALTRPYINNGLKVAIVPKEFDKAFLNQRVATIKANSNIANQQFIFNFLCTSKVLNQVKELSKTLNQPNLSIKDLKAFQIPLPPLDIQTQTVAYLDSVREKVEILKQVQNDKKSRLIALKASILDRAFKGEL